MLLESLPARVRIVEVGPRDGLQNESGVIPPATKIEFINRLSAAGLPEIEATSFVNPARIPQLADAEEVLAAIERRPGIVYSALVPNLRGFERALQARVDRIAVFTAASETFNQRNINASIAGSLDRFRPVMAAAAEAKMPVRGYLSTAFVCPYEGPIDPAKTVAVVEQLLELGVEEVSIGDTIGAAVPSQVDRLLELLEAVLPRERTAMHFHDTRGTALPNVLISLQRGIAIFDASAGGLGGCPYAPGASGNLATEDLWFFLSQMGIETGIDGDRLREASTVIERALGRALPSRVRQAGAPTGRS